MADIHGHRGETHQDKQHRQKANIQEAKGHAHDAWEEGKDQANATLENGKKTS